MLENATITRIDRITGTNPMGGEIVATGATVAIGCFADEVTNSQRFTLGAVIKNADRVVYVEKDALDQAGEDPPAEGDRITVALEDEAAMTGRILVLKDRVLDGLAHFECYLDKV